MKTFPTAKAIRNTVISVAAVTVFALPLFASASTDNSTVGIVFNKAELVDSSSNEALYARLQSASNKICGSSNLNITGSVRRSTGIQECYDGTLTAAVERLDNAEVTALHQQ